jgi:hypothetical protein
MLLATIELVLIAFQAIILPKLLQDIDTFIDYVFLIVYLDEITNEYTILSRTCHSCQNNILTALELSGIYKSKRKIKYGKVSYRFAFYGRILVGSRQGIESATRNQANQPSFDKNAFSRMEISSAMQVLSSSVVSMSYTVIKVGLMKLTCI